MPCHDAMYDGAYGVIPGCSPRQVGKPCERHIADGFATPVRRRPATKPPARVHADSQQIIP